MPSTRPSHGPVLRRLEPRRRAGAVSQCSTRVAWLGSAGAVLQRQLRFSMRTVLIVFLLASVALSWLVVRRDRARRQRDAVAAIESMGGWVRYDYQRVGQSDPVGPDWLRRRLGVDFLHRVASASLPGDYPRAAMLPFVEELELIGGEFTGEDLASLKTLDRLKELRLRGRAISQRAVQMVAAAGGLESLELGNVSIRDVDLSELERLPRLRKLVLAHADADDATLAVLASLAELHELRIVEGDITDGGVRRLANLTKLRRLQLSHCRLSDACLVSLGRIHQLRKLDLSHTQITGEGLSALSDLEHLEVLHLTSTLFDDDATPLVRRLPHLAELVIARCPITVDGVERLTHVDHLQRIEPGGKWLTDDDLPALKRLVQQGRVEIVDGDSWSTSGFVDLGQAWHLARRGMYDIASVTDVEQFSGNAFSNAQFEFVEVRSNEWRVQQRKPRGNGR